MTITTITITVADTIPAIIITSVLTGGFADVSELSPFCLPIPASLTTTPGFLVTGTFTASMVVVAAVVVLVVVVGHSQAEFVLSQLPVTGLKVSPVGHGQWWQAAILQEK